MKADIRKKINSGYNIFIIVVVVILVIIFFGYLAFWNITASRLKKSLDNSYGLTYDKISVRGFPLRIDVKITNLNKVVNDNFDFQVKHLEFNSIILKRHNDIKFDGITVFDKKLNKPFELDGEYNLKFSINKDKDFEIVVDAKNLKAKNGFFLENFLFNMVRINENSEENNKYIVNLVIPAFEKKNKNKVNKGNLEVSLDGRETEIFNKKNLTFKIDEFTFNDLSNSYAIKLDGTFNFFVDNIKSFRFNKVNIKVINYNNFVRSINKDESVIPGVYFKRFIEILELAPRNLNDGNGERNFQLEMDRKMKFLINNRNIIDMIK